MKQICVVCLVQMTKKTLKKINCMIHTLATKKNQFVSFDSSRLTGDHVQVRYVQNMIGTSAQWTTHSIMVTGTSVRLQSGTTKAISIEIARHIWNTLVEQGWVVSASKAKYPFITAYIKTTPSPSNEMEIVDQQAFLIERVAWLLRRHGCPESDRRVFIQEAAGNYLHTIAVIQKWVHTDLCIA